MRSITDAGRIAALATTEGADGVTLQPPTRLPKPWVDQPEARDRWRALVPALLRYDPVTSVIGVCSTLHGEGTSTLVAGLACAAAEADVKTIVVEAAARSQHGSPWQNGAEASPADLSLLAGIELATVAPLPDSPAPAGPQLKRVLHDLRGRARVVLIDLEPIRESAQALGLAGALDVIYLVVEAERERREVIGRSVENLSRAGLHVGGVILNKRVRAVPNFLYRWL